jgi:hypothetical protein
VIIAVVCVPIGEGAVLKVMSQLVAAHVDQRRAAEVRLAAEAAAAAEAEQLLTKAVEASTMAQLAARALAAEEVPVTQGR